MTSHHSSWGVFFSDCAPVSRELYSARSYKTQMLSMYKYVKHFYVGFVFVCLPFFAYDWLMHINLQAPGYRRIFGNCSELFSWSLILGRRPNEVILFLIMSTYVQLCVFIWWYRYQHILWITKQIVLKFSEHNWMNICSWLTFSQSRSGWLPQWRECSKYKFVCIRDIEIKIGVNCHP